MKVTRLSPAQPILNSGLGLNAGARIPSGGNDLQVLTSNGSNGRYWGENVRRITSNGSNTLLSPDVNFANGANITFSVSSNTLTIASIANSLAVKDEGISLATDATVLDFVGAGVTATGAGATKTISIPGGGGTGVAKGVTVRNSAALTTANDTFLVLTFDVDVDDDDAMHDTAANQSRLVVPAGNWHAIVGYSLYFAGNATGYRDARIRLNGTTNVGALFRVPNAGATQVTGLTGTVTKKVTTGDYFEVLVIQNSGGNLDIPADSGLSPMFGMVLVAR